jgi:hypothetical protein
LAKREGGLKEAGVIYFEGFNSVEMKYGLAGESRR